MYLLFVLRSRIDDAMKLRLTGFERPVFSVIHRFVKRTPEGVARH